MLAPAQIDLSDPVTARGSAFIVIGVVALTALHPPEAGILYVIVL